MLMNRLFCQAREFCAQYHFLQTHQCGRQRFLDKEVKCFLRSTKTAEGCPGLTVHFVVFCRSEWFGLIFAQHHVGRVSACGQFPPSFGVFMHGTHVEDGCTLSKSKAIFGNREVSIGVQVLFNQSQMLKFTVAVAKPSTAMCELLAAFRGAAPHPHRPTFSDGAPWSRRWSPGRSRPRIFLDTSWLKKSFADSSFSVSWPCVLGSFIKRSP